jgi:hypothetical protein
MWSSMFPLPNRPLVNFAHCGIFERIGAGTMRESLLAFSMSCLRPRRVPKRGGSEMASRMNHVLRKVARFSFTNVTHKTVDESVYQ